MPALRLLPRRSARLQALTYRPISMAAKGRTAQKMPATDASQAPPARGGVPAPPKKRRGRGAKTATAPAPAPAPAAAPSAAVPAKKTSVTNIIWEGRRSDLLVEWITSHAADRHILFHDSRSSTTSTPKLSPDDRPSGKNKKDVSAAIARQIFEKDPDHLAAYADDPSRYVTSVINRLSTLKSKYREHRSRFKSTGSGILPEADEGDTPASQNLLEDVLRVFPYYQELHAIWNGIPSFDSELVSSKPSANHAESLLGIIQPKSAASSKNTAVNEELEDRADAGVPDEDDGGPAPPGLDDMEDIYAQGDEQAEMDNDPDFDDEAPAMEDIIIPSRQESEARQARVQPPQEFTPFSVKPKGKTSLRDGRNSFTRHSPYPRSPSSAPSTVSMMTSVSRAATSTKRAASSGSTNPLNTKLAELDKASEMLIDEGSATGSAPSSKALRYTFAIRKQELDNQREELSYRRTDAEMGFRREEQLKKLDIQLNQEESHKITQQIELLRLQIELQRQLQSVPSVAGGPSSSSAGPSSSSAGPSSSAAGFP